MLVQFISILASTQPIAALDFIVAIGYPNKSNRVPQSPEFKGWDIFPINSSKCQRMQLFLSGLGKS